MFVSFPISRGVRVIVPWPVAVLLLPVAAGLWVLGGTVAAVQWVWRRRGERRRPTPNVVHIRITPPR